MDYFKKIERSVTISADKRSTVDLQVDVWSQDLNVTKFILKLDTTDSATIDLTNATVRVAMVYSQDGKDVKIEAAGIVEDVATQKIAYVMDDKLAGFEGLVIAGFYVTLSTGQRIDIQNVTFNMRKSLLDKDLEAATDNYYQTFDDIVADVQSEGEKAKVDINAVLPTVNSYADTQKQAIDDIVSDVQSTGNEAKEDIKATLPSVQAQVSELKGDMAELENINKLFYNRLSYEYTGTIPKIVNYDMKSGHTYTIKNESLNAASVSALETEESTPVSISSNLIGGASIKYTADKNYSFVKIYVNGGGTVSIVDNEAIYEIVDDVKSVSYSNTHRIDKHDTISRSLFCCGNSKVNFDDFVGMTFSEFRGSENSPIKEIKDNLLENGIDYTWIIQCSSNNSVQYGPNISLSIGIKTGDTTEWLVSNIVSNNVINHSRLSEANVFKFTTTGTWRNAVDSQTITYINVYRVCDGNNYSGYDKTVKNDSVNWWANKTGDSLGDSLTGQGFFQMLTKRYFNLTKFYNHGIGGTKLSGPSNEYGESMWMDNRINALNSEADFVTILGGQNDGSVSIGDLTLSNHDTDTFAGAFNVIVSKLYYKYLALDSGYYEDIDYSGVNKLEEPHNIIIIPCTPFFVPNTTQNLEEKANAIRVLSGLWSLNVADFRAKAQSSMPLRNVYWGTDTTHPQENFYKDRIAPVLIGVMEELKPIDWENTIYGS